MKDARYDLYERAATFEGPDFFSEVQPVRGSALMQSVHDIAESAVEHIATVTGRAIRISRLALNFKTDHKDRLWLLFASSVRLQDEAGHLDTAAREELSRQGLANTPLEMDVLQLPEHVRKVQSVSKRGLKLQKSHVCPTCKEKVEADALFEVSYKVLVDYSEQRGCRQKELAETAPSSVEARSNNSDSEEGQGDQAQVPEVFRSLHPRLSSSEYEQFLFDATFLHREALVCERCYLTFSSPQLGDRCFQNRGFISAVCEDEEPDHAPAHELHPERLRVRRDQTSDKILAEKQAEHLLWDGQAARMAKLKRAQSCPKLDYTPGLRLWPPLPLLSASPSPPQEPQTACHYDLRLSTVSRTASSPCLRRAPKQVPPLRSDGDPYLREVQKFIGVCEDRAIEVLGAKGARTYARANNKKIHGSLPALPSKAEPSEDPVRVAASQEQQPRSGGTTVWQVGGEAPQYASERDVDTDSGESDCGLEVAPASELARYLPWKRKNSGASGADTPTTRTPSHGTAPTSSLLGSRAGSRPSSRTSSRQLSSRCEPPHGSGLPAVPRRPVPAAAAAPRPGVFERPLSLQEPPRQVLLGN